MLNRIRRKLFNRKTHLQDRLFLLLAAIAMSGMLIAFFSGLLLGENAESLASTLGGFCVFLVIIIVGYRTGRLNLAANLVAVLLIFVLFPIVFFTSGGIYGGSPLWFLFCMVFVSMILRGRIRIILLVSQLLIASLCYYIQRYHPGFVIPHSINEFYLDSLSALIIIGVILSALMIFQIYVYTKENEISSAQKEEIEKLNRAQSRFFSSMSHEIRTPINTIIGLNEMILREEVGAEVAENAANIQAASKLLLSLINDILDMSQMQAGQMQLTLSSYRPGELVADVVSMMQVRAAEKELEFMVSMDQDIPSGLLGDEVRIKQILINILNNAIKYTKSGSVSMTVQGVRRQEGEELTLIISVTDTGIGIKKESIPYLFSAYKRMDEEKTRHIEGTGLGLSIVKQLLDLMGGRISVNSVYTRGSTFIVEIPQKITDETPSGELLFAGRQNAARQHYHQSFEAPSARVLAVDDTPSNLMVVQKLLRATKVQVDTAGSGAEALEKTFENEYQIILMDHMMPEMDGIECAERIRSQTGGRSRDARIVALTANAGSQERALYVQAGFDGYLLKPVGVHALEDEIRGLLPPALITASFSEGEHPEESASWIKKSPKRSNVLITAPSVADLPGELLEKHEIQTIPLKVVTEKGVFRDGVDIDTKAVIAYIGEKHKRADIIPLQPGELEDFFAAGLERANNIILLTASAKMQDSAFETGIEAARMFENVKVYDTGSISAGLGYMALEACRMAEEGKNTEEILEELDILKKEVRISFIVEDLEYLVRSGQIRNKVFSRLTKALMIRPVLEMRKGRMSVAGIYFGSKKRVWKKYIRKALKHPERIDRSRLFIGHVGLGNREINEIRTEVARRGIRFDEVIVTQASPVIAANAGPGTFGLVVRRRG